MVWAINGGEKFDQFLQSALALGNSTNSTTTGGSNPATGANSTTSGGTTDTSGALSTKSVSWAMIGLFAATMATL